MAIHEIKDGVIPVSMILDFVKDHKNVLVRVDPKVHDPHRVATGILGEARDKLMSAKIGMPHEVEFVSGQATPLVRVASTDDSNTTMTTSFFHHIIHVLQPVNEKQTGALAIKFELIGGVVGEECLRELGITREQAVRNILVTCTPAQFGLFYARWFQAGHAQVGFKHVMVLRLDDNAPREIDVRKFS